MLLDAGVARVDDGAAVLDDFVFGFDLLQQVGDFGGEVGDWGFGQPCCGGVTMGESEDWERTVLYELFENGSGVFDDCHTDVLEPGKAEVVYLNYESPPKSCRSQ